MMMIGELIIFPSISPAVTQSQGILGRMTPASMVRLPPTGRRRSNPRGRSSFFDAAGLIRSTRA